MTLPNYPSKVDLVDQLGIDTRLQVDILLHRNGRISGAFPRLRL